MGIINSIKLYFLIRNLKNITNNFLIIKLIIILESKKKNIK